MVFDGDGTKMYLGGNDNVEAAYWTYNLSTAWDISTANRDTGSNHNLGLGVVEGSVFGPSGNNFYECRGSIVHHTLNTPYDLGSASQQTSWGQPENTFALDVDRNGNYLFFCNKADDNDVLYRYSLSSPFDISSSSRSQDQVTSIWDDPSGTDSKIYGMFLPK